jgi:tetratricopeptide (TPR) repeat protein
MLASPITLVCLVLFGLSSVVSAIASPLQRVRFGAHGTYSRVVIDLQEATPYHVLPAPDPLKIVVEFPEVSRRPEASTWRSRIPLIREVHFIEEAAKVIAEIRLTRSGKVYRHAHEGSPPRIVIDIVEDPAGTAAQATVDTATTPQERPGRVNTLKDQKGPPAVAAAPPPEQATGDTPPAPQARKGWAKAAKEPQTPPAVAEASSSAGTPVTKPPAQQIPLRGEQQVENPKAPAPTPLSAPELLQLAERQWQQGKLHETQRSYQTLLERFPESPRNHLIAVRLADVLQAQGNYLEALKAYAKALEAYPGSEGALISQLRMAELGAHMPDLLPAGDEPHFAAYRQPLEGLQRFIQTYPLSPFVDVARFKIGVILLRRQESSAALETFRALLEKPLKDELRHEVQAKYRDALHTVMAGQQQQGHAADVLRLFFAYKGLLPPAEAAHPDLLLPVARSYAHLGLLPEAQRLFQTQLETAPTPQQRAQVALEQAEIMVQRGLFKEAETLLRATEAAATTEVRGRMLLLLGQAALQAGQPVDASRYLQRGRDVLETSADRAVLFSLLGESYLAQGQSEESAQALQQCIAAATAEVQPPLPIAEICLFRAAGVQFARRQYPQALSTYKTLLDLFPQTPYRNWALFRMAESSRALGDASQGRDVLTALRDTAQSSMWQKVAADALDETAWRKQFHERLAEFQNRLIK